MGAQGFTAGRAQASGPSTGAADPWAALSGAAGQPDFAAAWLGLVCASAPQIRAGVVYLSLRPGDKAEPAAFWGRTTDDLDAVRAEADRIVSLLAAVDGSSDTSSPYLETRKDGTVFAIVPVIANDRLEGGLIALVEPLAEDVAARLLRHLRWSCGWLEAGVWRGRAQGQRTVAENARAILEAISLVAPRNRYEDAARTFAGLLASRFAAARVAVGRSRRGRCRLAALAHSAEFEKSMNVVRALEEAMDEAVDLEEALLHDARAPGRAQQSAALKRMAGDHAATSILVLPMSLASGSVGALLMERREGEGFTQEEVDLADALVAALTPVLEDKRERSRSLFGLAGERIARAAAGLLGPHALGWKATVLAVVAGLVASMAVTTDYHVGANSIVEGEVRRVLVAPFDGFISGVARSAGDLAKAGDVMAELEDSELAIQKLRLLSQKRKYQLELDKATAGRDLAQSKILKAQIAQVDAQLSLTEGMIVRTRITAPFDGVVVSGDLSRSIGKPVGRGDELFELAPLDRFRVTALVPESEIHLIRQGAEGAILLSALPDTEFPITVRTVTTTAKPDAGVNGFEVIAELVDPSGRVRPGMEGVVRIAAGRASFFSIWTRSLWHWMRLKLWAWWP